MKRPMLAALALAAVAAAPATASAASIEVVTSNGSSVITYAAEARRGQPAPDGSAPSTAAFDLRMEFFEYAAPLTAGAGCIARFPVICGEVDQAFPVDVSLGDERRRRQRQQLHRAA